MAHPGRPGRGTGVADDDPSGIETYSRTSAQFGHYPAWLRYAIVWLLDHLCRLGHPRADRRGRPVFQGSLQPGGNALVILIVRQCKMSTQRPRAI